MLNGRRGKGICKQSRGPRLANEIAMQEGHPLDDSCHKGKIRNDRVVRWENQLRIRGGIDRTMFETDSKTMVLQGTHREEVDGYIWGMQTVPKIHQHRAIRQGKTERDSARGQGLK